MRRRSMLMVLFHEGSSRQRCWMCFGRNDEETGPSLSGGRGEWIRTPSGSRVGRPCVLFDPGRGDANGSAGERVRSPSLQLLLCSVATFSILRPTTRKPSILPIVK